MLRFLLALELLAFWPLSAAGQSARTQAAPTQRQSADVTGSIDSWMKCTECTEQDLSTVVRLGPAAVPVLGQILRDGPSAQSREAMRNLLLANYRNLKEFEKSHPTSKVSLSEQEYVKTYLDNFDARYRVRAATALSRIGGPEARTFLEEAQRASLRDDVKRAVGQELARINTTK